jgi:hypothetical protein
MDVEYGQGHFARALEYGQQAKTQFWKEMDSNARAWLLSDLALVAWWKHDKERCRQFLGEVPTDLDPRFRVVAALNVNRGLCQATNGDQASRPVMVGPGLGIAQASEARAALSRRWEDAWEIAEGKLPGHKPRSLQRCSDLAGVHPDDVATDTDNDYHVVLHQFLTCKAWEIVARAKPARFSHVQEVWRMSELAAVLPASLEPALSSDEGANVGQATKAGQSWRQYNNTVETKRDSGLLDDIRFFGNDLVGYLQWLAAGDFDDDGQEDLLLLRVGGPESGTAAVAELFVLTRSKPDVPLRVVRQFTE